MEAEIRRVIRDARAKDPLITVRRIQRLLEGRFQRGFSYKYIARVAEKVDRDARAQADRAQIEQRLNFTRDNYRMMRDEPLKIVYWSPEPAPDGERKPSITKPRCKGKKGA